MPQNTNTYGDISRDQAGYLVARMLKRAQHKMIFERFAQVDPQPRNQSKTRRWRRYNPLPRATAPLAEGVTPQGQKLTATDVTAVLEPYGDFIELSDVVTLTHQDPVLQESTDLCGQQAAETAEVIRASHLKAGSNVFYAGGVVTTRATVNAAISRGDLRRVVRALRRARAEEISKINSATVKIGTTPVAPAYFAVVHPDLDPDIRTIVGFVPFEQYSDSKSALPGEIGKVESIRFIASTLNEPWLAAGAQGVNFLSNGSAPAVAAQCDVYPVLIFAKDAYATVPLQGEDAAQIMVVNPKASAGDPLGQRGSVGWKMMHTVAILQDLNMARLEVAATANPV